MWFRSYCVVLIVQVWLSVSEIPFGANGEADAISLSERARELLQKGLKSINGDNTGHGLRPVRSSGCPFAQQTSQHRSERALREDDRQWKLAKLYEETTLNLLARLPKADKEKRGNRALEDVNRNVASVSEMCPPEPQTCNATSPYRTVDGSCNNLDNPSWGKAGTCMPRVLDADFGNGVNEPRLAKSGNLLPNPRTVSLTVHPEVITPDPLWSHFLMQFGQFLTHDVTHALVFREAEQVNNLGNPFVNISDPVNTNCCAIALRDTEICYPVEVPEGDTFYEQFNLTCLDIVVTAPCTNCKLGPRQHPNSRTSYIDLSNVYGVSEEDIKNLRKHTGGLLLTQPNDGPGIPPGSFTPDSDQCSLPNEDKICFQTGDARSNQHPALTVLQILWFREHNRVATELQAINPHWSDEKIFQEARKIVIAETQHIVYTEYLPAILGSEITARYQLNPLTDHYTVYDPTVDATVVNEFSAASFRFGHSQSNNDFLRLYSDNRSDSIDLKDNFFYPFDLHSEEIIVAILRGMAKQDIKRNDRFAAHALTQHNLGPRDFPYGIDLVMTDMQRSRERGVTGYAAYLELCTGIKLTSFGDLARARVMPRHTVSIYAELYEDVRDIDLVSGGLSEHPLPGAIVGPTFACLVADEFKALKFGDRFYYEHGDQAGSFTPDQLQELRNASMSKIICDNTNIEYMQPNALRAPLTPGNEDVLCDSIRGIDLWRWADTENN